MIRPVLFRLLMASLVVGGSPVTGLVAQEVECDLQFVPVGQDRAAVEVRSTRGGGSLSLPFLDDFASPTFAADEAVQIFGGYGYMKHYPVERLLRDAKGTEIYEGTSEIMRRVIAAEIFRDAGDGNL